MQVINESFVYILTFLYTSTGSLFIAITVFTIVVRLMLMPLSLKSIRATQKVKDLQPKVDELKKKYKDAKELQKKQLELYQKYNVNPLAGCLPQIAQLVVFIMLYNVFFNFLNNDAHSFSNVYLFGINLLEKDSTRILPIMAAVTQLMLSVMIAPGSEVRDIEPNTSKNKKKIQANKKEEDMASMASTMQQQMLYIFPFMTGFIAMQFPAGLVVYWIVATVFSIYQQYYVSGWGGIETYSKRAMLLLLKK